MLKPLLVFTAIALGAVLAVQTVINADVARRIANPLGAGFLSITVSFVLVSALLVARGGISVGAVAAMPWYLWIAGVLGFFVVFGSLSLAPRLGASTMFASIVAGQMIMAVAFDAIGFAGVPGAGVSGWRIAGVACVLAGVLLFQRA